MGYALAEAARDRGAAVTLAAGPTAVPRPAGNARARPSRPPTISTRCSCGSFRSATASSWPRPSSDFIPETSPRRLHRSEGEQRLRLNPGRDILASLAPLRARPDGRGVRGGDRGSRGRAGERSSRRRAPTSSSSTTWDGPDIGFDADDNEVLILGPSGDGRSPSPAEASAKSPSGSGMPGSPRGRRGSPPPLPPGDPDRRPARPALDSAHGGRPDAGAARILPRPRRVGCLPRSAGGDDSRLREPGLDAGPADALEVPRGMSALQALEEPDEHRLRPGQPEGGADVRRRGAGPRRGRAGARLRRAGRPAADQDHRGDRA